MFQRILVVFENEKVSRRALTYARELAVRMDSEVSFLMLVEMAFLDRSYLGLKRNAVSRLEERMGKRLTDFSAEFLKRGIPVAFALRMGDPAEEFLKFLAERLPFHAVIWGSSDKLPQGRQRPRDHWINKVAGTLECPLLTVTHRSQGDPEEEPEKATATETNF